MALVSEHDMLVTLATMAIKMNDLTGHDVIEALRDLGHGNVVKEARKMTRRRGSPGARRQQEKPRGRPLPTRAKT